MAATPPDSRDSPGDRTAEAQTADAPALPARDPADGPKAAAPTPSPESGGIPGVRLILWLFIALGIASALSLWVFVENMGDCDADGVPDGHDPLVLCGQSATKHGPPAGYDGTHVRLVVYRALAADLAIPVIAWFLLQGIGRKGKADRWFWFAGALPAGLVTVALALLAMRGANVI
jgi:hypothetical protein